MFAIVDRFEGEYAVIEMDGGMVNIKLSKLPAGVKEGDVLSVTEDGFALDKSETARRKEEIERSIHDIWVEQN